MSVTYSDILPSVLESIRNYTGRSFATSVGVKFSEFTVSDTDNSISSIVSFDSLKLHPGDYLEFIYSDGNPGILVVKSVDATLNKIYTCSALNAETLTCSLVKLSFVGVPETLITQMIKYQELLTEGQTGFIKKERIGDASYELAGMNIDENVGGYPKTLMSMLDPLKKRPGNRRKDYIKYGFLRAFYGGCCSF